MAVLKESQAAYLTREAVPSVAVLESRLDLPKRYAWFNELNSQERLDFFAGLLEALTMPVTSLPNGRRRTRMAAVNDYLRGWQATIEIESSPSLVESARQGMEDARLGRFVPVSEVEEYLGSI